ncbi:MAG: rhomboid family intramembrane serine protease [Micromonosporaceae bacterium]|nr:rhomboid family intramembrane serine protease [Micromonosporaceae bacterium]
MKDEQQIGAPVCYRHPSRETYVRCTRCDRPICPDCMHEASVGFHCPECVAEARRTVRAPRTAFGGSQAGRHGYVTYTLIGVNVLVALMTVVASGAAGFSGGGLFGNFSPLHKAGAVVGLGLLDGQLAGVAVGEYWRLFTAMFLHFGLLHLGVNMWALWILGRHLEQLLGPARFLALYLVSGIGGNVAVYWLTAPNTFSVGASTAVFGLFAAIVVVNRKLGLSSSGIIGLIVINMALSFLVAFISWQGHLGGLVTGGLVALGLAYAPRQQRTPVQVAAVVAVVVLLVVLTFTRTDMLVGEAVTGALAR